jgi:hypothetical protein
MHRHFSFERLGLLLRADLMSRARSVLIVSSTLAALMLLHGFWTASFFDPQRNIFGPWFVGMLLVWGPIMASYSFRELHDKTANEVYLLLPASALDKTVARLLLATVLFGVFVVALVTVVSWLNAAICLLFVGASVPTFSVAGSASVSLFANALVGQSMFFLGAAWFRKSHLIRTSLALTLGLLAFLIISVLIVRIVYYDVFSGSFGEVLSIDQAEYIRANSDLLAFLSRAVPALYFFVLPPFCWYVAWLRVKETQVSYGI